MRFDELSRTTTFRLTVLYGVFFALGTVAMLSMVYLRSVVYLSHRVDDILNTELAGFAQTPRNELIQRITQELALNGVRTNVLGLFTARGERLAGNLTALPAALHTDGQPLEVPPTPDFPASARLIARRLPSGELMVVGRDLSQLQEMRSIVFVAVTWSGAAILVVGLACGMALSAAPLKRLQRVQAAAREIAEGDMHRRMPTTGRRDELDMFATTVNYMMDEVERLISEIRGTTAIVAHDLLNPLATATLQLRRLQESDSQDKQDMARVTDRIETVLDRFRAILRIAELEARQRRAGFQRIDLARLVTDIGELYAPLAEAAGVRLLTLPEPGALIEGDPKLLFEAVGNLVDNAIKFAGRGSTVQVRIGKDPARPQLIVQDDGPGIPAGERTAVLHRFYRAERSRDVPGLGLGLSVVAAILRLHGFQLLIEDADPGVRAVIDARHGSATAA